MEVEGEKGKEVDWAPYIRNAHVPWSLDVRTNRMVMVQDRCRSEATKRGSKFKRKHCTPIVRLGREYKCRLNADTPTTMA